ncbi:MAG: GAF domain-containing protein, partial [Candidatus Binatia bacterium]
MSSAGGGTDRTALLLELSRAFGSLTEIGDLLPLVNARTKEALDAESCAIMLLDEERRELYFPAASDASAEIEARFRMIRVPADRGVSGWVMREGKGTFVPDASRDVRFNPDVDRQSGAHTRSLLYAPLRTRQGILGVIGLRNKRAGTFTEDDL